MTIHHFKGLTCAPSVEKAHPVKAFRLIVGSNGLPTNLHDLYPQATASQVRDLIHENMTAPRRL